VNEVTVDLPFTPYPHQRAAHAARLVFRFLVLVWHRRGGKTVFAVLELLLAAIACKRERGRYGYIAPLLKQSKAVAWDYLKHYARGIPGTVVNESDLFVDLPNGARIRLFGADNPDAFRGLYFDGVVLDEVADMRPQVWGEIIRPALADRQGWAIFIGTPKGVNLFSELYHRALRDDGWKADLKRASETGVIPPEELEQTRKEMTASQFAQEMDCDFAAAVDDVLLRLDDVLAAQKRSVGEHEHAYAGKVLGVDVARYGDDRTVLFPRQGILGMRPKTFRGLDTMEVAGQVAHFIDKWTPDATFIDVGGIGAGVMDRLRQLNYAVVPVDFGSKAIDPRYENKRAEMWWLMADWVRAGGCLPDMPEMAQELTAPRYTYKNARGRLQLESKDDMRARGLPSPDIADALACTFAFPVGPSQTRGPLGQHKPRVLHEYDPFQERV
jgi:hypothetical protein